MCRNSRKAAWITAAVVVCAGTLWAQSTRPASESKPTPIGKVGVVKGTNVYVRSGPSTNYYPVLKLNTGDKIKVVESNYGWLTIDSPPGTYSLIDSTFIDKTDDHTGTCNGDRVWVYAGSDLDKRNYAKQVQLNKGDKINILGTTEDKAFCKITPPAGAHLYMSADFVDLAGGASKVEPVKPGDLKKTQVEVAGMVSTRPADNDESASGSLGGHPVKTLPPYEPRTQVLSQYQTKIKAIESEISAELAKPIEEQVLEPMLPKLKELAEQSEDLTAQLYAQSRIKQMQDKIELNAAVKEMQELRKNAISEADRLAAERARMKPVRHDYNVEDLVVHGEIVFSGLYDGSGSRPKRWRVVDPETRNTIAYIVISPGSSIDPAQYYGKFVGVKASKRELIHGTIPPVPVYTVLSIEVVDPQSLVKPLPGVGIVASPASSVVETPASQPATMTVPSSKPAE